jgi:Tfp pilus assembly protein PilZ
MTATDPITGKFNITTRLFKLVSDLPKDQQLILLKQLLGDNVSNHLYKLIVGMTEEQQIILLEQMAQLPKTDLPEKMLSLEETEASMRENARKPCLINTKYRIQDREFKSYILDVSVGGVFIETKDGFPKGKDLLLKFSLPNRPQPFTFSGKIAWSSPKGFGVKFDNVTPSQGDILKSFIEQNE